MPRSKSVKRVFKPSALPRPKVRPGEGVLCERRVDGANVRVADLGPILVSQRGQLRREGRIAVGIAAVGNDLALPEVAVQVVIEERGRGEQHESAEDGDEQDVAKTNGGRAPDNQPDGGEVGCADGHLSNDKGDGGRVQEGGPPQITLRTLRGHTATQAPQYIHEVVLVTLPCIALRRMSMPMSQCLLHIPQAMHMLFAAMPDLPNLLRPPKRPAQGHQ